ncbi:OLC1v1015114C1 [Oldenlandia corymbosa var. corymbosa]|uniref:OLC1v1015114C1 n=1 Tax=Oldenlandia corymbosa var. corymbosa TaxID=529605 RepID=A0AAV1E4X9_OLDCO|nr:OLC1v1015114C1 [Oldenlandia corymbosa var. corymbosa]
MVSSALGCTSLQIASTCISCGSSSSERYNWKQRKYYFGPIIGNGGLVEKQQLRGVVCFSSKKKKKELGFMDQILDYIEGGPKLRRWYGAPDLLPRDGSVDEEDEATVTEEEEEKEEEGIRDAVLVTDGNSEIGQMVILSLIVKRMRVKALVKDKRAAMEAFGTYVESIAGSTTDSSSLRKALRGARAVICTNEGFVSNVESWKGVDHIILLSQLSVYRGNSGIQAIMNSNARKLAEQDESALMASGIPYTIIRAGALKNTPGGQGFSFKKDCATQGSLSKEDAAFICVEALDAVPEKGFMLEVVNGEEKVSDWKQCFEELMGKSD